MSLFNYTSCDSVTFKWLHLYQMGDHCVRACLSGCDWDCGYTSGYTCLLSCLHTQLQKWLCLQRQQFCCVDIWTSHPFLMGAEKRISSSLKKSRHAWQQQYNTYPTTHASVVACDMIKTTSHRLRGVAGSWKTCTGTAQSDSYHFSWHTSTTEFKRSKMGSIT